ncbi:hypothetical protein RJ640_005476 [Escallonia rubra]|uniref:Sulfite exporter TauE/SafE family protein n=1 Tax=Escallonia rubra TaxID=112253 RepID=A0AA88RJG2_9ASTE|nr:hypothetical protein RJ640_005476 [Escallonia rubra]
MSSQGILPIKPCGAEYWKFIVELQVRLQLVVKELQVDQGRDGPQNILIFPVMALMAGVLGGTFGIGGGMLTNPILLRLEYHLKVRMEVLAYGLGKSNRNVLLKVVPRKTGSTSFLIILSKEPHLLSNSPTEVQHSLGGTPIETTKMKTSISLTMLVLFITITHTHANQVEPSSETNESILHKIHQLVTLQTQSQDTQLRLKPSIVAAGILCFIASSISSAGGIGGGGLFISILTVVAGIDLRTASSFSAFMVTGGSFANVVCNMFGGKTLIDYDIALLSEPCMLFGVSIGVICNVVLPEWLITTLFAVFLAWSSFKTCKSGVLYWRLESEEVTRDGCGPCGRLGKGLVMRDEICDESEPLLGGNENCKLGIPWMKLGVLILIWFSFFLLYLLRGNRYGQSMVPGEPCGVEYWILSTIQGPLAIFFTAWILYRRREKLRNKTPDQQATGAPSNKLIFPVMALLAGLLGGVFGIGGGMLISPLLLQLGIAPEVTAATCSFMVFFSSSMSAFQYLMLGMGHTCSALVLSVICFCASLVGLMYLTPLEKESIDINSNKMKSHFALTLVTLISIFITFSQSLAEQAEPISEKLQNDEIFQRIHQFMTLQSRIQDTQLKFEATTVIAGVLCFLAATISSAGGIGGGGLFIPILTIVAGLDLKTASSFSAFMVTGGSVANVVYFMFITSPKYGGKALIDYDIALLSQPFMLLGVSIGVVCNIVFPEWLITILFATFLGWSSFKTCRSGVWYWKLESEEVRRNGLAVDETCDGRREVSKGAKEPLLSGRGQVNLAVPWMKLVVLVMIWFAFFLLYLLRGNRYGQGIVTLEPCGVGYWILSSIQLPLAIIFTTWILNRREERPLDQACYQQGTDFQSSRAPSSKLIYPVMALLTGLLGGVFGIGGGMLISPLLLQVGIAPEVTAATCSFMVFSSSTMSAFQYLMFGMEDTSTALVFSFICFAASLIGLLVVQRAIGKHGRASLIVFSVGLVLVLSTLLITSFGALDVWMDYRSGRNMGFKLPC